MKLVIALCVMSLMVICTRAMIIDPSEEKEWTLFKAEFGKNYATAEEDRKRMNIYFDNKKMVNEYNERYQNGEVTFTLALNEFSDLNNSEFVEKMTCYKSQSLPQREFYVPSENEELPSTVDWRDRGAVTPVKDQGACRSCWAFSTVGSIEGQHFLKTKKLVSLSEQNLVDCISTEMTKGCWGGMMDDGFTYVKNNKGIDTEDSYPYIAKFNASSVGAMITGYKYIPIGDEKALQSAVANVGPISVAVDIGDLGYFTHYHEGIITDPSCGNRTIDLVHAIVAVGYGTEGGEDYWLLKNSMSAKWGMSGYLKLRRNHDNMCGVASDASYPLV